MKNVTVATTHSVGRMSRTRRARWVATLPLIRWDNPKRNLALDRRSPSCQD